MKRLLLILLAASFLLHCVPAADHATHGEGPAPPDSGISPKGVNSSDTKSDANASNQVVHDVRFKKPTMSNTYEADQEADSLWCIQQKAEVCSQMKRWVVEGLIEARKYRWLCEGPGMRKFQCE